MKRTRDEEEKYAANFEEALEITGKVFLWLACIATFWIVFMHFMLNFEPVYYILAK